MEKGVEGGGWGSRGKGRVMEEDRRGGRRDGRRNGKEREEANGRRRKRRGKGERK